MGFAGVAGDLNPEGAVGEADRASAGKGEAAADCGIERFIALPPGAKAVDLSQLTAATIESMR